MMKSKPRQVPIDEFPSLGFFGAVAVKYLALQEFERLVLCTYVTSFFEQKKNPNF